MDNKSNLVINAQKFVAAYVFFFMSVPSYAWTINYTYSGPNFNFKSTCATNTGYGWPFLNCFADTYIPPSAPKAINGVLTIDRLRTNGSTGWVGNISNYQFSDGNKIFTPNNSGMYSDVVEIDAGFNISSWDLTLSEKGSVPIDLLSPGQSSNYYVIGTSGNINYSSDNSISGYEQKDGNGYKTESSVQYYGYESRTVGDQKTWKNDARKIYLDFGGGLTKNIKVKTPAWESKQYISVSEGSYSAYVFDPADQLYITEQVQKIYFESGIPVSVTNQKPTETDYITVNFGAALPVFDSDGDGVSDEVLGGLAYDVMKTSFGSTVGVDQFDQRKDGNVAVFVYPSWGSNTADKNKALDQLAKTAAHEAGHAMGARHVNPFWKVPEVMDYDDSGFDNGTPIFPQIPVNIQEQPYDNGVGITSETHNPAYHIRRYAIGEDHDYLDAMRLQPGSWDEPSAPNPYLQFVLDTLDDSIESLSVIVYSENSALFGEGPVASELSGFDPETGVLNAFFPKGSYLEIVGSTIGSDNWDVAILFDYMGWAPVSVEDLAFGQQASILRYDQNTNSFMKIGTMNVKLAPLPVPEPDMYIMFLAGVGLMFAVTKKVRIS